MALFANKKINQKKEDHRTSIRDKHNFEKKINMIFYFVYCLYYLQKKN